MHECAVDEVAQRCIAEECRVTTPILHLHPSPLPTLLQPEKHAARLPQLHAHTAAPLRCCVADLHVKLHIRVA